MTTKKRGEKGYKAEDLFAAWLRMNGWLVQQAGKQRRPIKTPKGLFYPADDFFGAFDGVAIKNLEDEWEEWWWQVTTQGGRSMRRRRIEAEEWPEGWLISIVSHEQTEDPANRARRKHYWKTEYYSPYEVPPWHQPLATAFDMAALEAFMREERAKKKEAKKKEAKKNVEEASVAPQVE